MEVGQRLRWIRHLGRQLLISRLTVTLDAKTCGWGNFLLPQDLSCPSAVLQGDNRAKAEARVLRGAQDFACGDSESRFSLARLAAAPQGVLSGQHSMSTFCSSTDMSSLGPRKMLMRSENRTGNSAGCSLPVNSAAALTPPQHRAYRLLEARMVKARYKRLGPCQGSRKSRE